MKIRTFKTTASGTLIVSLCINTWYFYNQYLDPWNLKTCHLYNWYNYTLDTYVNTWYLYTFNGQPLGKSSHGEFKNEFLDLFKMGKAYNNSLKNDQLYNTGYLKF